jgi:hypothetical protein
MATISMRHIAEELIKKAEDGTAGPVPPAEIWEYRHVPTGKVHWAVFYDSRFNDLGTSPRVGEYALLWSRSLGRVNKIGVLG